MAYDLLIKNGRIVDGSGMPSFHGRRRGQGRQDRRDRQTVRRRRADGRCRRPGRGARLYRQSLPLRRAGHLGSALLVLLRPRRDLGGDRQLLAVSLAPVRKGNATRMAEFLSYVEAIPMEVLNTIEVDWETFPQYMDRLDRNLGVNVGTLIGHTAVRYYVMGEECQKRTATDAELKEMQSRRARQHGRRRARPVGVAQQGPLRPAGRAYPGAVGRREGDFRARRGVARDGHRHHPVGRRPRRRDDGRADGAAVGSDRPAGRLQQSRPERAPPRRLAEAHGAGQRDRRAGHPRLPAVLAEHDDADLQHEQHAGVPRRPDLAPDPALLGRGETARLCRPGGARQAPRRDGRVEGRDPRQHDLARMVQLHLGRRDRFSKRTTG